MDALIYTLMSGAERSMRAQQVHANNLANMDTPGFRADMDVAVSEKVGGPGYDSRYMARLQTNAITSRDGAMRETGRDLDAAALNGGYFTVQLGNGEAYTRAGNFSIDADGALTSNGRAVMGEGGPIVLPPYQRVSIDKDGTISVQAPGEETMQPVEKLKLVKPEKGQMSKNEMGLEVTRNGEPLPADDTLTVQSGHLEGSNVSAVEEMVSSLSVNRDFEIQMKLYKVADEMTQSGNKLVGE
jgi:flagellar basal-body rod protein FlgF